MGKPIIPLLTTAVGAAPAGALIFKGEINVPADFPTLVLVQNGWTYIVKTNVTDNDPTKTNTGQSFLAGDEIAWNGTNWTELGSIDLWVDDGTDLKPIIDGRNINALTGLLKDNDVTAGVAIGDASNTSYNGQNKSIIGSLNQTLTDQLSAGYYSGGAVTDNLDGKVNVAAGFGFFRISNSPTAKLEYLGWSSASAVVLTDNSSNYIYIDYNAGTPIVAVTTNGDLIRDNENDKFEISEVYREGNDLQIDSHRQYANDAISRFQKYVYDLNRIQRANAKGGLILGETGTRNVTVTQGWVYIKLDRSTLVAIDTSGSDTFDRYYSDGGAGWIKQPAQTQWDNAQYDGGGGSLVPMTGNKYSYQDFYEEGDGGLISIYAQAEYVALSQAENAPTASSLPGRIGDHALYIGRIVFQRNALTAQTILSAFTTILPAANVTDHGNLAGLPDDDHTQYALLLGRAGSQILIGGTAVSENLTLQSTSNATKGKINLGIAATSFFTETTETLTLNNLTASSLIGADGSKQIVTITALPNGTTATTQAPLDNSTKVATTAYVEAAVVVENLWDRDVGNTALYPFNAGDKIAGGTGSAVNLTLTSTSHATKANINLGSAATSFFDEVNERLTISDSAFVKSLVVNSTAGSINDGIFVKSSAAHGDLVWQSYQINGTTRISEEGLISSHGYYSLFNSSDGESIRLWAGGNSYTLNNWGIGTGNPLYRLAVWDDADILASFARTGAGPASIRIENSVGELGTMTYIAGGGLAFSTDNHINLFKVNDGGSITFNGASANNGLAIKGSGGNEVLHLYQSDGTLMAEFDTDGNHPRLLMYDDSGVLNMSMENLTGTANRSPGWRGYPSSAAFSMTHWAGGVGDTGTAPLFILRSSIGNAVTTARPLLDIQNYTTPKFRFNYDGKIGINTITLAGQASVYQGSTTAAIPVLYLTQLDTDEPFLQLVGGADQGSVPSSTTDSAVSVIVKYAGTSYRMALWAIP